MLRILHQKEEALVSTTSDMDLSHDAFLPKFGQATGVWFSQLGRQNLEASGRRSLCFVPWNMKIRRNFNRRSKQGTNSQGEDSFFETREARCLPASSFKIWNIKLHGKFMMLKFRCQRCLGMQKKQSCQCNTNFEATVAAAVFEIIESEF